MEFVVSFDMRAPAFGASADRLYAAALDISAWADRLGFQAIGLGEHHASDDDGPIDRITDQECRNDRNQHAHFG